MIKTLKYLFSLMALLAVLILILLKQPLFQDRLLEIGIKNMNAPASYLPAYDALTAVVCGSRSPINDPNRAEACI